MDHDDLELRAYLALQGLSGGAGEKGDWRDDLVAVLRSPYPLSNLFREMLATAFEGDLNNLGLGFRLELKADGGERKRRKDAYGGIIARREWMKIGLYMRALMDEGVRKDDATLAAADHFYASEKKCQQALTYYYKATDWANKFAQEHSNTANVDILSALELFHSKDSLGNFK